MHKALPSVDAGRALVDAHCRPPKPARRLSKVARTVANPVLKLVHRRGIPGALHDRRLEMKIILALLPAIAGALMFGSAASAQPQMAVPYADLDLRKPQAIAMLDKRLVRASRKVCAAQGPTLEDMVAAERCQREALAEARVAAARLQATIVAGSEQARTGS